MSAPLVGLRVRDDGRTAATEIAGWFLRCLGAQVTSTHPARSPFGTGLSRDARGPRGPFDVQLASDRRTLTGVCVYHLEDQSVAPASLLAPGTLDYATGLVVAFGALLVAMGAAPVEVSSQEVLALLLLPTVMAALYGAPDCPRPAPPRRLRDLHLSCEFATRSDEEAFHRLCALHEADGAQRHLVRAAQEWRLPVLDYRRRPRRPVRDQIVFGCGWDDAGRFESVSPSARRWDDRAPGRSGHPLEGVTVCDLTALWAGPLATWLLASAGARVVKVEPQCRFDGMRGLDGGGIYPGGDAGGVPGNRSGLFNALNRNKERVDLDLREDAAGHELVDLVARADLVVDSFSPRVMPNLNLTPRELRRHRPDVLTMSLPAFPPNSPRRNWIGLGAGIHAIVGLGDDGAGRFAEPAVSYPDPLCGFAAAATAVAMVIGRRRGWRPSHARVPLASATAPLLRFGGGPPRPAVDLLTAGAQLASDPGLAGRGFYRPLEDSAGVHDYPRAPYRGAGLPVAERPAPLLTDGRHP